MKYQKEPYGDEIDRMRARKKQGERRRKNSVIDDFEIIEDLDEFDYHQIHSHSKRKPLTKKRKRYKKKKWVFWIILLAILLVGHLSWKRFRNNGYWTVVVYGVDSRDGNLGKGALADVQILCSINRKTGEIRLASVFRDTYLKIDPEGNYHKINEAYFRGGREQAGEALKENLDLHIEDYATFNWKAVADAINILGGIDLEITDREFAYINSFITETVNSTGIGSVHLEHSGMNHLDGVQAVAYASLRLMDTDFNRTERQRKVMGLAMEKAKNADFNTLRVLIGTVFPQISTSIGVDDLMLMAKDVKKYYIGQTTGFPFSHTEMLIEKRDCVVPTTLESNVIQLHEFLYDDTQFIPSGVVKNISAHIAKVSGIDTPGKDTESGKNVGAKGNNGEETLPNNPSETSIAESMPAEAEPTESMEQEPPESESATDTDGVETDTTTEGSTDAGPEPIPGTSSEPQQTEESPITSAPIPESPAQGPVSAPGGSDIPSSQGPGVNGPGESTNEHNGALEAPGQGQGTGPVSGPGA